MIDDRSYHRDKHRIMPAPADFLSASPEDAVDAAASRSDFAFTKSLRPV
jgi:hypothetical protein